MKFTAYLPLTAAVMLAGHLRAQDAEKDPSQPDRIKYQLILPEEKTPETLKPSDPNPYSKKLKAGNDESSSEENAVREVLMGLPVTGISNDPDGGKRIMLGPIRLERGMIVPQVLPEQGVRLKVNSVSDSAVELVWIEKKNTGLPPRTLILPFNVKPTVRHQLPVATAKPRGNEAAAQSQFAAIIPAAPPAPTGQVSAVGESTPPPAPPPTQPPANASDPNHPANMLMNLLLNKSLPTQQPTVKE